MNKSIVYILIVLLLLTSVLGAEDSRIEDMISKDYESVLLNVNNKLDSRAETYYNNIEETTNSINISIKDFLDYKAYLVALVFVITILINLVRLKINAIRTKNYIKFINNLNINTNSYS